MNKLIGYILLAAGILVSAFSYPELRAMIGLSFQSGIDNYILIVGVVILIVGAYMSFGGSSSSKQPKEVPIYKGKQIVGYRQMK